MASNPEQTIPLATELKLDEAKRVAIPEPPNEAEKRAIWKSQVLIPFSVNGTLRAILGPLKVVKHDRPNSLPEEHESFHPSVRGEELILAFQPSYRMPFLSDPKRAFRSAPPNPSANDKAYLKWLDRVEEDKRQHWKDVGILDLIQLSRSPISYNPAMLLSALYFWERSTNCLHVPFGMITPTLLDVAAITGLWPIGDDYHSAPAPVKPISIPTDNISFSRFIKDHYVESGEVSDAEHVAFLLYWLSAYVFCTKSLRIPAKLLPLANLLHEGRQLAMARLVLGNLYQMLNEVVEDIRNTKTVSLNAAGPLWLFQLWLNAVFESLLPVRDNPPTVSNTRIDAHRLETLTHAYDASSFEADFRKYFTMFLELKHYRSSFSPYSKAVRGPFWLRNSYPNASDSALPKEHHITLWRTLLSPRVLTVGFASSDYTLCGYNPQLVSRQFGLSQVLPNTLFDKSLVLYPGAIKRASVFDTTVQFYNKRLLNLSPFTYAPSYYATNAFKAWWSEYWAQISKPLVDCLQCMTDAFLLQKQDPKKTKGMHLAEIRSFQEFFGVVYYPTLRLRDTVAKTAQVLRQKWELKAKKSKLVVPPGEEGLSFVIRKTGFRFPSLPTSKFALAFPPVLPKWVDHVNINVLANQALPPRKRVTWTKYHLWNFPYHVPVEIFNHISLNMRIGQGNTSTWPWFSCFTS
ncbi:uncharacterized protein LOC130722314 [Lotus japonicus]|uniref:uncharacterized protein LOC130722314 n=1 Tax=Lotus japonicus TaxID=34305 RepID=UPI00258DC90A|nr:uncharacterized protein LOC130722314 [Lotus japonicus]